MKLIAATAGLVGLLYITAALSLYLMQRKFIYYPTPVVKHSLSEIVKEAMDGARLNIVLGTRVKTKLLSTLEATQNPLPIQRRILQLICQIKQYI